MAWKRIVSLFCVLAAAAGANAVTYDGSIEYIAGSGSKEATIVIDFDFGNYFMFAYKWDSDATGWDALEAIDTAGALVVDARWYEEFQSHFVNDFYYAGGVKYDYGAGASTGWGYWGSSDNQNWTLNTGVDNRVLYDGGWDSWVWSNYDYSQNWDPIRGPGQVPVPEPGTIVLVGAGALLLERRRG